MLRWENDDDEESYETDEELWGAMTVEGNREMPASAFWSWLLRYRPIEWIEDRLDRLALFFRELVADEAKRLYEATVLVTAVYTYSPELYKTLKRGDDTFKTRKISKKTSANGKICIEVMQETSLRKLTRDFRWRHTPDGEPRATEVRFAIREQLRYLLSRPGMKAVDFCQQTFQKPKKGFAKDLKRQIDQLLHKRLPAAYKQMIKGKLRKKAFFLEHPAYNAYTDVTYALYRLAGEKALAYFERAVAYGIERGERNTFHDAIYPFATYQILATMTAATARRMLEMSLSDIRRVTEAVRNWIIAVEKDVPHAQRRKMMKTIVFAENPVELVKGMLQERNRVQEEKAFKALQVGQDIIQGFMERMNRYAPEATLAGMLRDFGTTMTRQVLNGTYPGLFRPEIIPMPLQQLGWHIEFALGNNEEFKGAQVNNPKRLYHHLSKLGDERLPSRARSSGS